MELINLLIFVGLILVGFSILNANYLHEAVINTLKFSMLPVHFEFYPRRLKKDYKQILERNCAFYANLNRRRKRAFESRVKYYLDYKEFKGGLNFNLTPEMKLTIIAAAVRLTFGLKRFKLLKFETIVVYEKEFYSGLSKAYVKGETTGFGVILFSWEDIVFGNSDSNDSLNVLFHEFAHAIFLDGVTDPLSGRFRDIYRDWLIFVNSNNKLEEATSIKGIFRDYASYNENEFFAVAVENFFERPEEFKSGLPELYKRMCELLGQNPLLEDAGIDSFKTSIFDAFIPRKQ